MINPSPSSPNAHGTPRFVAGHCVFDHPAGARGEAEIALERRLLPLLREQTSLARFVPVATRGPSRHRAYGLQTIVDRAEWTDALIGIDESGRLLAFSTNGHFMERCGVSPRSEAPLSLDYRRHNHLVELPGVRSIERWVGIVEGGTQDVEAGHIVSVRRIEVGYQICLTRFEHIELEAATAPVHA